MQYASLVEPWRRLSRANQTVVDGFLKPSAKSLYTPTKGLAHLGSHFTRQPIRVVDHTQCTAFFSRATFPVSCRHRGQCDRNLHRMQSSIGTLAYAHIADFEYLTNILRVTPTAAAAEKQHSKRSTAARPTGWK